MNQEKEKKDRRLAAWITSGVHFLLLVIFIFFGLKYMEPKPEDGIPVNFGYQESASGSEYVEGPPAEEVSPVTTASEASSSQPISEEVVTQDIVDAATIDNRTEEGADSQPTEEQQEAEEQRQVDSRLDQLLQQPTDGGGSSEGIGEGEGDMGDPQGDPDAPHGDGGGLGGDGNYRLGNRKALKKPLPDYDCNAQGRVVVLIRVNRSGKVIFAESGKVTPDGVRSTTTSSCLFEKARSAAMKTKWQADPGAAEEQLGFIIYNFKKR